LEPTFGLDIPHDLGDLCRPERMALLLYDMQVGIVSQIPTGAQITARVMQILRSAREGGFRVFFTRHMSLPNEVAGVTQLRTAMAWQHVSRVEDIKPWFLRDSPGFQLVPELAPLPSEAVLDKITMSAFAGTPLDIAMRDCGLISFAIAGIALEVGIAPTVHHATDLGYIPVVVADACGFRDQAAADRALASFRFAGNSLQTDVETICRLFQSQARTRGAS
jgi:nicotinamidase-related amidase